jgi:hypothetical protein
MAPGDLVITAMRSWSESFVERPHPVFGGLPVCPFARPARARDAIQFEVQPFSADDPLAPGGLLMRQIAAFAEAEAVGRRETLFVIHPDPRAISAAALEGLVARLNAALVGTPTLAHLRAFEAHPESAFCVEGVYTRRSPYPSFQILSHGRLKATSDALLKTPYYRRFTPEMLRALGVPRH